MLVSTFLEKHPKTCWPAKNWLKKENIETMSDAWEKCERSDWLLWVMEKENMLIKKQRIDIGCRIIRTIWHLLTDDRSKNAIEVGERYVKGETAEEELLAADVFFAADVDYYVCAAICVAVNPFTVAAVARRIAVDFADTEAQHSKQCQIIREMFDNPFKEVK